MMEVAFCGVEDDIFQREVQGCGTQCHFVCFVGICGERVEELRRACRRSFSQQAGKRSSVCAVTFARCAQTAIQVNLECCCPLELIVRKLGHPLEEIVRNPHWAHCVRTRGPGTHLVELFQRRHNRTLRLLDYGEFWRESGSGWSR